MRNKFLLLVALSFLSGIGVTNAQIAQNVRTEKIYHFDYYSDQTVSGDNLITRTEDGNRLYHTYVADPRGNLSLSRVWVQRLDGTILDLNPSSTLTDVTDRCATEAFTAFFQAVTSINKVTYWECEDGGTERRKREATLHFATFDPGSPPPPPPPPPPKK